MTYADSGGAPLGMSRNLPSVRLPQRADEPDYVGHSHRYLAMTMRTYTVHRDTGAYHSAYEQCEHEGCTALSSSRSAA